MLYFYHYLPDENNQLKKKRCNTYDKNRMVENKANKLLYKHDKMVNKYQLPLPKIPVNPSCTVYQLYLVMLIMVRYVFN